MQNIIITLPELHGINRRKVLQTLCAPAMPPIAASMSALAPSEAKALAPFMIYLGAALITGLTTLFVSRLESKTADRRQRESSEDSAALNRENLVEQRKQVLLQMDAENQRHRDRLDLDRETQRANVAAQDRGNMISFVTRMLELDRQLGKTDGVIELGNMRAQVSMITDRNGAPLSLALTSNADGKGTAVDINHGQVVMGRGGYNGAVDGTLMRSLALVSGDATDAMFVPVGGAQMGLGGRELSGWFDTLARDLERRGKTEHASAYHFVAAVPFSRARRPTAAGADHQQALFVKRANGARFAEGIYLGRNQG